jgi:catechol 2,3-dioxygenase-like lactoylglutathione lyase family enzyme
MRQPRMRISATVLGAPDPPALGAFYARLLGWNVVQNEPTWVMVEPPDGGGTGLSFQHEAEYVPPVWPPAPSQQQMMSHLDIAVDDLQAGVAHAIAAGATQAEFQPQEHVRVMLDPAGHPFCLFPGQV